ncbi:MAG: creatinine amidohydrolase/Fe(II)-dependent formamide hydrolase-like protein [Pseudohongiellaceae bacterium]|jgi:creatinine amidohydrolase/Fe(II)-dependent formamide hydrolase-like protein
MIIQPRKFKAIASVALMVISTACGAQNSSPTAAQREAAVQAQLAAERPIAAGSSYWLEELTSLEIRDLIASGTTTVIISTGGIEENGPYLATGKHNLILEGVCPALAEKLGNALCAPLVKFVPEGNISPPTGSMRYPGTISLSASTYEALLTDIASSLKQSGFTDIVMIGDSGGNQSGMANVADGLGADWIGDETRIHFVREFYDPGWVATEDYTQRELGVAESGNDGYHDDIWVTAMMMVTDPDQVRFSQRVNAGLASINGVAITPLEDTIELGRKMIEFRAEYTARAIQKVVASKN